jgi:DNA-binding GntR family transcriptional regulator
MVRDFGVSRMTVNRAFRELAAEGLIARTQGEPPELILPD